MKLVDILARELKVWPDQYVAVIQDEGGYLHGCLSQSDLEDLDQEDLPFEPVTVAWDGVNTIISHAQWQAAVDALESEKSIYSAENVSVDVGLVSLTDSPTNAECKIVRLEWNGEGLPPAGTVCEVNYCESWQRCEIIAHFKQRCGMVAAFTVEIWDSAKSLDAFGSGEFRPIRTPEQIAAEESLSDIEQLYNEGGPAAVYDAGYRKQKDI